MHLPWKHCITLSFAALMLSFADAGALPVQDEKWYESENTPVYHVSSGRESVTDKRPTFLQHKLCGHKGCIVFSWGAQQGSGIPNCPSIICPPSSGSDDEPTPPDDTTPPTTPDDSEGDTNVPSVPDDSMTAQVVALVNEARAQAGLNPVAVDSRVQQAAQVRAAEQAQLFSHTRPDGTSCFTALSQAGVSYRGAGENIAYGQRSAQAVMQAWMNSEGHRANILNSKFTTIGVGYTVIDGVPYWAQMFTY